MLTILLLMAGGIALGYALRGNSILIRFADKATLWSIFLLLFLMGHSIGINELIMEQLPRLGYSALLLSLGSIAGSILLAWMLRRYLAKEREA